MPNRCAGLIALNPGAAELFEAQFGRRVHVIPNFVPRAHDRVSTSRRAGWLYVGRLTREKGVDRLLGSWPKGEALDLVGDGPLAVEAQELAERNPLVRRLGMIPRSEVLERMGRYEGLILPSMAAEQMPTVVLEALAAGVPCILSQHVAAGAALKSEGVAVLYDPSAAPEHLAEALSKVRATGGRMSAAALRVFEANYSPESWRHEVEGLYDAILGDTSSIT